jgi:hypothetical protein
MGAKRFLQFLAGAGLLALAACVADRQVQAPAGDFLSHEQLSALLSKTRTVRIATGRLNVIGIYAQDGTAQVDWGTGGAKGTWRIYDNRFCTRYPGIRQGFETCYFFRQTGENTYTQFFVDGNVSSTWVVEK